MWLDRKIDEGRDRPELEDSKVGMIDKIGKARQDRTETTVVIN
jgi:hypothetical protein